MGISYTTGADIYADVLARAGIDGDSDKVKRYINRAYYDLLQIEPWPWALKYPPGIINVLSSIEDTLTATEGSATVTLTTTDSSSTNLASSNDNYKLWLDTNQIPYRIISHSGKTVTLDATWKEDSVTSASACTIFKDEYNLASDCTRPWSFLDRNNGGSIDFDSMKKSHSQNTQCTYGSNIESIAMLTNSRIVIKPWLKDGITIEYLYCEQQTALDFSGGAAGDTPIIPVFDRHVIADMAYLLELKDWKDEAKVDAKIKALEVMIAGKLSSMRNFWINTSLGFSGASA